MTVTDSVWCAKPPRHSRATAATGLVDAAHEHHPRHQHRAEREGTAAGVDQRRRLAVAGTPPPPGRTGTRDRPRETAARRTARSVRGRSGGPARGRAASRATACPRPDRPGTAPPRSPRGCGGGAVRPAAAGGDAGPTRAPAPRRSASARDRDRARCRAGGAYQAIHPSTQTSPSPPATKNAARQL